MYLKLGIVLDIDLIMTLHTIDKWTLIFTQPSSEAINKINPLYISVQGYFTMNIIIAILDQDKKTLGYKADSFWSIMQKEDAKTHETNEANQIATHLIPNLLYFLNGKVLKDTPKESWLGCTKLFIALEDVTGKQTIIYSLHRVDHNLNGQDKPWIADTEI